MMRNTTKARRTGVLAAWMAAGLMVVSGCSAPGDHATTPDGAKQGSAEPITDSGKKDAAKKDGKGAQKDAAAAKKAAGDLKALDADQKKVPHQAKLPKTGKNDLKARKEIVQSSCKSIKGGWSASGEAKNSGEKTTEYKITIYFATSHGTVLDFAKTSVTVGPGKSASWKAEKKFKTTDDMLCAMPSVEATRA